MDRVTAVSAAELWVSDAVNIYRVTAMSAAEL
jgi:hypothetical protein